MNVKSITLTQNEGRESLTAAGSAPNFTLDSVTSGGTNPLYVADGANNRVITFTDFSGTGWTSYGSSGTGIGQFGNPIAIKKGPDGKFYIYDGNNSRIARIDDFTGTNWTTLNVLSLGYTLSDNRNANIAFDASKRFYFNSTYGTDAHVFRSDDITGTNFVAYGALGSGVGQFNKPYGIALDSQNRIYIADYLNNRIVRMDDMAGTNWTTYAVGEPPNALAVDSANKIYYWASNSKYFVRIDDMTGANLAKFGSSGSGVNQFNAPSGLYINAVGQIVVYDQGNGRVVFMNDFSGHGWKTYGTSGSGVGQFGSTDNGYIFSG